MGGLKKTDASSLLEVTVGLVLITIVFGISLTVFLNVSSGTSGWKETKYRLLLQQVAAESLREQRLFDEVLPDEHAEVIKKVENYQGIPGLLHLKLEAVDEKGRTLATYNRLIYAPESR